MECLPINGPYFIRRLQAEPAYGPDSHEIKIVSNIAKLVWFTVYLWYICKI